jgi:hypothetical protein
MSNDARNGEKSWTVRVIGALKIHGIDAAYEQIREHYLQCLRKNTEPNEEIVAIHLKLLSFDLQKESALDRRVGAGEESL